MLDSRVTSKYWEATLKLFQSGSHPIPKLIHKNKNNQNACVPRIPPPPHDYPYYWAVQIGSQAHTIEPFILDPKPILLSSSDWIPSPHYWAVQIGSQAHTIEQFILDPKPILLSSSYWIPSPYYWAVQIGFQAHTIEQFILDLKLKHDKVKVTNLKNLAKLHICEFWSKNFTQDTPSEVAW